MDAKLLEPLGAYLGPGVLAAMILAAGLYRWWIMQGREDTKEILSARQILSADQKSMFEQLRSEIERKTKRVADLEAARRVLEADRDRGWNLARELDDRLHDARHDGNNRIQAAYSAGRMGLDPPAGIPPIPPMHDMVGKPPAE